MNFNGFINLGYISFETAKLLIDKHISLSDCGYTDEGLFGQRIGEDGECIWFDDGSQIWDYNYEEKLIPAPELFYVQKWLRDEKGAIVYCIPSFMSSRPNCWTWVVDVYDNGVLTELLQEGEIFDSYEISLDKGLREALKLIQ